MMNKWINGAIIGLVIIPILSHSMEVTETDCARFNERDETITFPDNEIVQINNYFPAHGRVMEYHYAYNLIKNNNEHIILHGYTPKKAICLIAKDKNTIAAYPSYFTFASEPNKQWPCTLFSTLPELGKKVLNEEPKTNNSKAIFSFDLQVSANICPHISQLLDFCEKQQEGTTDSYPAIFNTCDSIELPKFVVAAHIISKLDGSDNTSLTSLLDQAVNATLIRRRIPCGWSDGYQFEICPTGEIRKTGMGKDNACFSQIYI